MCILIHKETKDIQTCEIERARVYSSDQGKAYTINAASRMIIAKLTRRINASIAVEYVVEEGVPGGGQKRDPRDNTVARAGVSWMKNRAFSIFVRRRMVLLFFVVVEEEL
ncbi:hypothetical protein SeMB42_g02890 [Synchytrium endobioticum]|uniref:Uncharacterized protein n=1 Tax=Synchytrium endobioticum TaxID=286115 RepID=A0A507DBH4_9FUNG|nr:hypothetical protein SeMB42_g02890 [Synchytrium endobioticum]